MLRHFSLHRAFQQGKHADSSTARKKKCPDRMANRGKTEQNKKGTHEACDMTAKLNRKRRINVIVLIKRHNASEFKIKSLVFSFQSMNLLG
jgi:hypothetical protein